MTFSSRKQKIGKFSDIMELSREIQVRSIPKKVTNYDSCTTEIRSSNIS